MSRVSVGAVVVLLACVGLVVSGHLGAQENEDPYGLDTDSPERRSSTEAESAEESLNAVLDQKLKTPLAFDAELLSDVVARLADEYELPIVLDHAALDEIAISPETEVTLSPLHNLSLRSALNIMLRQPGLEDLTYIIEDEVLMITTEERANETVQVVVYRVDDFKLIAQPSSSGGGFGGGGGYGSGGGGGGGGGGGFVTSSFSPLIKVIPASVEFDSWQSNGTGEGSIFLVKPGMLVISQTRRVHGKIEQLLGQLRDVKAEIEGDHEGE